MQAKQMLGLWVLLLGLSLSVSAEDERRRDDGGAPAAPEPTQVLLLAGGLALTGAYVAWHRRRVHAKRPS